MCVPAQPAAAQPFGTGPTEESAGRTYPQSAAQDVQALNPVRPIHSPACVIGTPQQSRSLRYAPAIWGMSAASAPWLYSGVAYCDANDAPRFQKWPAAMLNGGK